MANAILLAVVSNDEPAWYDGLRAAAPEREIRRWPDHIGDPTRIAYACTWKAPHGLFANLPNLKAIFNLGAGADRLLADPALPDVPIARAVHRDLTGRMVEYIVLHVLMHHRHQRIYDQQQRARVWRGVPQPAAEEVTVGIMGMGAIGGEAAVVLSRIGFRVIGWSRTRKQIEGVESFAGDAERDAFLARTEILVAILPYTPATHGILDLALFRKLRRDGPLGGAYLINVGRGASQIDADIVAALDEGVLAGASLDVFPTEPLPAQSPLWSHSKLMLTPHTAGDLEPAALARDIVAQIRAFERGEALPNLVDRARGY
jgi:glyoxylate/hydroxypyruvate reductase A